MGEGQAELCLLNHLLGLYVSRGCGVTVKVSGGYGKGGKGVLDYAIGQKTNAAFDTVFALLDNDTDWNDAQRARAAAVDILVIESAPCIEAWLLDVHHMHAERASRAHKAAFDKHFGYPAHEMKVYQKHFTIGVIEEAKARVPTLRQVLTAMTGALHSKR